MKCNFDGADARIRDCVWHRAWNAREIEELDVSWTEGRKRKWHVSRKRRVLGRGTFITTRRVFTWNVALYGRHAGIGGAADCRATPGSSLTIPGRASIFIYFQVQEGARSSRVVTVTFPANSVALPLSTRGRISATRTCYGCSFNERIQPARE